MKEYRKVESYEKYNQLSIYETANVAPDFSQILSIYCR